MNVSKMFLFPCLLTICMGLGAQQEAISNKSLPQGLLEFAQTVEKVYTEKINHELVTPDQIHPTLIDALSIEVADIPYVVIHAHLARLLTQFKIMCLFSENDALINEIDSFCSAFNKHVRSTLFDDPPADEDLLNRICLSSDEYRHSPLLQQRNRIKEMIAALDSKTKSKIINRGYCFAPTNSFYWSVGAASININWMMIVGIILGIGLYRTLDFTMFSALNCY